MHLDGRRSMRGAALIAAVLVAAIVAAIAVALTTRDQYAILSATRLQEQRVATDLAREIEVQAATMLTEDIENSGQDDEAEAWASARFTATRNGHDATATLVDAQRLFNLNGLAFQPPTAAAGGSAGDDVPPPVEDPSNDGAGRAGGGDRAGQRALLEVSPGIRDLAPPGSPDGNPGTGVAGDPSQPPGTSSPDANPQAGEDAALSPQQIAVARFNLLLQALQLPPELVPSILDWLDADSDTRFPNGAEDEYYTRLERPYRTANGAFADISELRLVRGITPEIYAKLAPHVTVLDNTVPLNVNTATADVLMSVGPGIDRATADLLVTSRKIQPWPDVTAFLRHPLLVGRPLVAQGLATRTAWFELHTRIEGEDGPLFRRSLIERLGPNRLRIARRERLYHDG